MVDIGDLVTAMFGYPVRSKIEGETRTKVINEFQASYPELWLEVIDSAANDIRVCVDTSKVFYNIFTLRDFDYSKSHKNFTISKGSGKKPRVYVALPKPGDIKKMPEYIEWRAQVEEWQNCRTAAIRDAVNTRFEQELKGVMPEYQEVLALTDETAKDYFVSKGWEIPAGVSFENFRPSGWILTSRPDGYGHDCGTYANMDWENKRIYITGWSSDD
jgi:hypothetical protein